MPFALDPAGRFTLLISDIAMQTQNVKTDARCCSSSEHQYSLHVAARAVNSHPASELHRFGTPA
jgi:hypothetical protein